MTIQALAMFLASLGFCILFLGILIKIRFYSNMPLCGLLLASD